MSQYEIREYYIEDPQLPKLFLQSWSHRDQQPQGCVMITHGISEHSQCYDHVAKALCDHGWIVYGWDLQGHGNSQGQRGFIKNFSEFSNDLKALIKKIKEDETKPTDNFHLIGHSMGGLITLQTLLADDAPEIKSAVLSNPVLSLAIAVPKLKKVASVWLNNFWPTLTLGNEVRHDILSRDPSMMSVYAKDPLRHTKISAPLFLGMLDAMESVKKDVHKLKTPVFFQVSGDDQLVAPQGGIDLFKSITGPKKLKLYEDSYHELYNDLNKEESIDDLVSYLGQYQS